jgi:hypothetical protein
MLPSREVFVAVDHRNIFGITILTGLRHCATGRKVAGSIPDGVIGIFH